MCGLCCLASFAVTPVVAQENKEATAESRGDDQNSQEESPKLRVGDPAPPLVIDEWMQGEPIAEYSREKFYIVEFWATWCGPCIKAMPHLSEIADHYRADGLEVVAVTSASKNPHDAVEKFVSKRGKDLKFRFAFSETNEVDESFMAAAGRQSIPCSFVIDRDGKIAFIGLPHDLDYVVSRVAKNQWRGQADLDELNELNESIASLHLLAQTDNEKALALIKHIEAVNPKRAESFDFMIAKITSLCVAKQFDAAKSEIERIKPKLIEEGNVIALALPTATLTSKELNPDGVHVEYAESVLAELKQLSQGNPERLMELGSAFMISQNMDKAIECLEQAKECSPDEEAKASIGKLIIQLKVMKLLPIGL